MYMTQMFLTKQITPQFVSSFNFVPQELCWTYLMKVLKLDKFAITRCCLRTMDISELFNHAIQKACCCEKYFKRNVDTDFFWIRSRNEYIWYRTTKVMLTTRIYGLRRIWQGVECRRVRLKPTCKKFQLNLVDNSCQHGAALAKPLIGWGREITISCS